MGANFNGNKVIINFLMRRPSWNSTNNYIKLIIKLLTETVQSFEYLHLKSLLLRMIYNDAIHVNSFLTTKVVKHWAKWSKSTYGWSPIQFPN